mgnify:CR=1 FL=1
MAKQPKPLTDEQKAKLDGLAVKNPELDAETSKAWQQVMLSLANAWRQEAAKWEGVPGAEKAQQLVLRFVLSVEQTAKQGPARKR